MESVREIKAIFILGWRTVKEIFIFLLETKLFLIIAFASGIAISIPVYYAGIEKTELFQKLTSLGLVLGILVFFSYRSIKKKKEEEQFLSVASNLSRFKVWMFSFIYSAPLLLPRWLKFVAYSHFIGLAIYVVILALFYLTSFFLIDFLHVKNDFLFSTYAFNIKIINVILKFLSEKTWFAIVYILELFVLLIIFNAKGVFEKSQNLSFIFWFYFLANVQTLIIYGYLYSYTIYNLVAVFF